LVVVLCSAVGRADSFTPQYLFTLPYGSGHGQIGVWLPGSEEGPPDGPTGIAVGRDGSVYIADSMNKRIQGFSPSGELLLEAKGPVDRKAEHLTAYETRGWGAEIPPRVTELENIQYVAVDSRGCVYVQFGAAMNLLAKFAADGQALWYMAVADELPLDVMRTYGSFYGNPTIGPGDTLCMRISGRNVDGIAIFDANGRFLKAVSGHACTPNGRIATLERWTAGSLAQTVRFYDMDGIELSSYVADPAATDPALFAGDSSFYSTRFDGADNLYRFAMGSRPQRIVLSPALSIGTDIVVVRFDASGHLVASVRFPGSPFPSPGYTTVDYAGNIYRLAYGADAVDVVRYVLDTSTQGYTSTRDH
jgi:hypothetical protein